jgi:hypothetical protein
MIPSPSCVRRTMATAGAGKVRDDDATDIVDKMPGVVNHQV